MDRWFSHLAIPLTWQQFRQLPAHPAYRYEYRNGVAHLNPRLRRYHGLLDLSGRTVSDQSVSTGDAFRPIADDDWEQLPELFANAFASTAPFSMLEPPQRLTAAQDCITRTLTGEFGLLVAPASFVAIEANQLRGAILITLLQAGDLESFDDPRWQEIPPEHALESRWGRPHITWVFTHPRATRHGLGSVLLSRAADALLHLGYTALASTFLLGNEPSLLWHWRNGFRLMSYVGSPRRFRPSP